MDPDQTAPLGAVWSGPHCLPVCKNSADDINRRCFQMQFFLAFYGLMVKLKKSKIYCQIQILLDGVWYTSTSAEVDARVMHPSAKTFTGLANPPLALAEGFCSLEARSGLEFFFWSILVFFSLSLFQRHLCMTRILLTQPFNLHWNTCTNITVNV